MEDYIPGELIFKCTQCTYHLCEKCLNAYDETKCPQCRGHKSWVTNLDRMDQLKHKMYTDLEHNRITHLDLEFYSSIGRNSYKFYMHKIPVEATLSQVREAAGNHFYREMISVAIQHNVDPEEVQQYIADFRYEVM